MIKGRHTAVVAAATAVLGPVLGAAPAATAAATTRRPWSTELER